MSAPGIENPDGPARSTEATGEGRTTQVVWTPGQLGASRYHRLLSLLFDPASAGEPPLAEDQGRLASTNQTAGDGLPHIH